MFSTYTVACGLWLNQWLCQWDIGGDIVYIIIIIIILFVLKVQKYTTIQAWYKHLTICDNYLKKKKKWSAYRKKNTWIKQQRKMTTTYPQADYG